MVLPVDRCRPEDQVEEGTVEDFFNLTPLPSLRSEGGFLLLGPHRRRGVGRKRPRRIGEAHQRLSEHGGQEGTGRQTQRHNLLIGNGPIKKPRGAMNILQKNVYLRKNQNQ